MRRLLFGLTFLSVSCATMEAPKESARLPASESIDVSSIENRLRPFESDGCSKFSSGISFPKEERWGLCCVQHDISYWKGGTSEDRYQADQRLQSCIIGIGEPNIARLVYWGVRSGTNDANTAPSPWGYGWVLNRGNAPFSVNEKKQVDALEAQIPTDLEKIPLVAASKLSRPKESLTGNYCLDSSVMFIQKNLSRRMTPLTANENETAVPGGIEYTVSIMTKECYKPYVFTYFLRKKDSCTRKLSESQYRLEVVLKDIDYPQECQ